MTEQYSSQFYFVPGMGLEAPAPLPEHCMLYIANVTYSLKTADSQLNYLTLELCFNHTVNETEYRTCMVASFTMPANPPITRLVNKSAQKHLLSIFSAVLTKRNEVHYYYY